MFFASSAGPPPPRHARFDDLEAARAHLDETPGPYVVKADGLAAGKGVVVAETRAEAHGAAEAMLGGEFGPAGAEILIEEFLPGVEASFFALCDGVRALPLIAAQDHKRAFDGDKGPNTGGMGAYAPAPAFTDAVRTRTIETIVEPVLGEMARRGAPYRGVLYVGLMIDDDQPRVVEFNARFGDPECQILMRLLKSDVLPLLDAAARGDLSAADAAWSDEAAALVVLAAEGYPGPYEKGAPIRGLEAAEAQTGVVVFHAGTRAAPDGGVVANGGRVLNVSAVGRDVDEAVARAYAGVDAIDWPGGFFRTDIGRPRAGGGR
ncbi:MAG: phosphoribosylamine--glycine ligase [Parvularculaceae bacterium]